MKKKLQSYSGRTTLDLQSKIVPPPYFDKNTLTFQQSLNRRVGKMLALVREILSTALLSLKELKEDVYSIS